MTASVSPTGETGLSAMAGAGDADRIVVPTHRYVVLDGLRGVAALCVMVYHFTQQSDMLVIGGKHLLNAAGLSVDLFFVLSGFVLSYSYSAKLGGALSAQDFLVKRVIRLYPLFLVGLIVGIAANLLMVGSPQSTHSVGSVFEAAAFNAFYLPFANAESTQNFSGLYPTLGEIFPLNPPAWSLFFEMVASVMFLFLYKYSKRRLFWISAVAFVGYLVAGVAFSYANGRLAFTESIGWGTSNFAGGFPRVVFGFTLGVLLHKAGDVRKSIHRLTGGILGGGALYAILAASLFFPFSAQGLYAILFLVVLSPVIVAIGAEIGPSGKITEILSDGLGWLSYPVYCLHLPIGRIVYYSAAGSGLGEHTVFALACVSVLVASMVAGVLFDVPVRRRLSQLAFGRG